MPKRTKEQIIQRMNEIGVSKRVCLGNCPMKRVESDGVINEETRTVPFILISDDNSGERYDWWSGEVYIEELDVDGANFERLRTFFTDHRPSVDNAIGRIENARVEGGMLKADVIFGGDERSKGVFEKYRDGILTDVSIGYRVNDVVITEKKGEPDHVMVTDYEVVELSAVWRGFDSGASVGRSDKTETNDETEGSQTPEMDGRCVEVLKRKLKLKEKIA
ncbi:peptidase [Sulfurovum mangrovi]|uniref:peptidase n=1 Tax=Sulfurovum mangrovi TaxID=2893889 RepID=UPI001E457133|nr:peptidase [Sulfurovum mangrovi]UFH59829.1 peptidase [Sulfurovum mangrovi]UFH59880.1 peptidase [Sulfurovum mangrovi]